MESPVVISHSPGDADPAMAVCSELERRNVRCWIASRDIAPGDDGRDAVAKAIRHAKVMVLIVTRSSAGSPEMTDALAAASLHELAIIPLCVDDVALTGAPASASATYPWIALFRNSTAAIDRLASRIAAIAAMELPPAGSRVENAPEPSRPSQRSGGEFASLFVSYTIFFGVIGILVASWFPVALGLLLFFPAEGFIAWALAKMGVRVIPDMLGENLIKASVFIAGWGTLLAFWKQSGPVWLSSWVPTPPSWPVIGGVAVMIAVLSTVSAAVTRRLLPRAGITIARDSLAWTTIEFLIGMVMLGLLIAALVVGDWLGAH